MLRPCSKHIFEVVLSDVIAEGLWENTSG